MKGDQEKKGGEGKRKYKDVRRKCEHKRRKGSRVERRLEQSILQIVWYLVFHIEIRTSFN